MLLVKLMNLIFLHDPEDGLGLKFHKLETFACCSDPFIVLLWKLK